MAHRPKSTALLEVLQVREIINRYCPSEAQVDQGTVAMVLILNRLTAPRPLVHVADGVAQTVLTQTLGVSADKFNDDRLGRLLDALAAHPRDIWLEIVNVALVQFDIDLHFSLYDLTALVAQGAYADSQLVAYGFAHNTPSGKQKGKLGATASADGDPGRLCRSRRPDGRSGNGAREHGPPVPALGTSRPIVVRGAADW